MKAINAKTHEVQAILQGRRTQMRCIVKPQPDSRGFRTTDTSFEDYHGRKVNPPYQPGDILYVRETWALPTDENGADAGYQFKADYKDGSEDWKWKPSIHMPKEAARIFLRVKSVRAERLQDISKADAIAEGIEPVETPVNQTDGWKDYQGRYSDYRSPVNSFRSLWLSVYGTESWNSNPWVWVIEFEEIPDPR